MIKILGLLFGWALFLGNLVQAEPPQCTLRVATLRHFNNPYGLGPLLKKRFQEQSPCEIRYITFKNYATLLRALPNLVAKKQIEMVVGLLEEDFDTLPREGLSGPRTYAFSPVGVIYNTQKAQSFSSLQELLMQKVDILVPHPQTSQIGKTWKAWTRSLTVRARLIFYPSWDLAYQAFLHGKGAYVVSYTSSLLHLLQTQPKANHYKVMLFAGGHPQHHYAFAFVKNHPLSHQATCLGKILRSESIQDLIPSLDFMYPANNPHHVSFRILPLPDKKVVLPYIAENTIQSADVVRQLPQALSNTVFLGLLVTFLSLLLAFPLGLALYAVTTQTLGSRMMRLITPMPLGFFSLLMLLPSLLSYAMLRMSLPHISGFIWLIISMTWLESIILAVVIYTALQAIPFQQVFMADVLRLSPYSRIQAIVLPHLYSLFSGPLLMTLTILNGLHVTPFLFDVENNWLNLNAFLYQSMNRGAPTTILLYSLIIHMVLAWCIVRIQGALRLVSSEQASARVLHFPKGIAALFWLTLIIWVAPLGLSLWEGTLFLIEDVLSGVSRLNRDVILMAARNSAALTFCGVMGGLCLIALTLTNTLHRKLMLKVFDFLSALVLIAPLFFLARFSTLNELSFTWLALGHILLVWGWAWRYFSSGISSAHEQFSLQIRIFKPNYRQRLFGIVWPILRKPLFDFLPLFIAISIGESLIITSLSTIDLITLPTLILAAMQRYRFAEASALTVIFFGFYYFLLLLNSWRRKHVEY